MNNYDLVGSARPIQGFIDELSTWYLRRSRDRFKAGDDTGVETLGYVLQELAKVCAPFVPFLAENIYLKIGGQAESVHLEAWPQANKKLIDQNLLNEMNLTRQIVEKGLAARAGAGIKIRQPLTSYQTNLAKKLDDALLELIKDELNVKEVKFAAEEKLDTELTEELKQEGMAREIIRQINQLRKEAGLTISDKVIIFQQGLDEVFSQLTEEIKKATLADKIEQGELENMKDIGGGKVGIKKN